MAVVGSIPEQIVFVLKSATEVTQSYTGKVFQVRPAFIVDANSEKMVVSAKNWGNGYNYHYGEPNVNPTVLENKDNTVITELRIMSVEHRGEGGVAYKAITPDIHGVGGHGYLIDLREDEFMEAVFQDRIKDGVITGEYIWSRAGSQMRLVRVGSEKHLELLESGKRAQKSRIPVRQLVVGNAYRGKGGGFNQVFLGRVSRSDDPKFEGKKLFAWRSIGEDGKTIDKACTITQNSSMVEDLGPTGVTRKGSRYFRDGWEITIHEAQITWL